MSTFNQNLIDRVGKRFRERFGSNPFRIARAPGRVNLLGEHVDYNDGFVIPAAIERAAYNAFSPSPDGFSHILADDLNEEIVLTSESAASKKQSDSSPIPGWGLYPAGVMNALVEGGYNAPPINAVFASDVPPGAGLSSSASIEMAFFTAWQALGGWPLLPMQGALLCQKAERVYIGVNCGIMDQFASACGVKGNLLYLDCRSLEWETITLPENASIVIADTMSRRNLTLEGYNQRRSDCDKAVAALKPYLPEVNSLRDISNEEFNRYAHLLPPQIERHVRHVVEEIERTRLAKEVLAVGDAVGFGRLMNECHDSLRDLYEVSSFELDTMAALAQSIDGCFGARLTGAGFGGCVVCLVETKRAEDFTLTLAQQYRAATGVEPEIYSTWPAEGAGLVDF